MSEFPVDPRSLPEHEMIRHAVARSVVEMTDGTLCQLVSWGSSRGRGRVVVEFQNRRRRTFRKSDVALLVHPGKESVRKVGEPTEVG